MKRAVVISTFFFIAFALHAEYHPMLAIGKKWNHVYVYGHLDVVWENGQSTMTIVEDGKTLYSESIDDTVRINDVKYFVVKNLHTAAGVQPLVYMREDTIAQKVWVLPNKESEEQLLYSFNVAIGDTLRDITFYPAENRMLILSLAKYIVTNINLTDGRKTIQLHAIVPYGPELDPEAPPFEHDFTWIEGIGERRYGLSATWYNDDKAGGISSTSFLCVQQDGDLLYATAKGKEIGCEYPAPEPTIESLCDTWNVMETDGVTCGGCETYRTRIYRLHADTIIGEQHYARLLMEGLYAGALREGNNRDIYCIPAGTTHEYLLYAFNAKQGEALSNLWLGGQPSECPDGWTATIDDILETTPRTFVIRAQVSDRFGTYSWNVYWKEGVGLYSGPMGREGCLTCANSRVYDVLCAYKDNEQVYANPSMSSKYGCYYDSNEQQGDTVQLYRRSGDGPGSSTVDPVDPNQIVAILQQDLLIMREYTGEEIQYTLQKSLASNAPAKANAPAMSKRVQADTFRGSASLRLTENGTYRLDLTNPEWDYSIYGEFDYGTTDVEPVMPDTPATKLIRNDQLLILKGDKLYTPTGVQLE